MAHAKQMKSLKDLSLISAKFSAIIPCFLILIIFLVLLFTGELDDVFKNDRNRS